MEDKADYSVFFIETEDLILKKAKEEDWKEIYHNLWCHEESAKYMLWDVTTTEQEAIGGMKRTVAFQKANNYTFADR